ncbi:hypothetical protein JQ628_07705 [Bradyrhizobium lablabi]|uniref:hypothetical protein n=1 Tax=Bradyrhizobium lablabi TaxID=722472 RepID=UPI001BA57BC9|nr:hypothetical protein [Bradyrhizobium lablabi]MBR1121397.1 hypothetical protein [Bradyrhizobium lablabi]
MAEAPEKDGQGDKQPVAVQQGVSGRRTVTMVSLAALAIIGAAIANSFPKLDRFALPDFDQVSFPTFDLSSSLPNFDHVSLPNFSWPNFSLPNLSWDFVWPNFNRTAALPPQKAPPPPMPDPVIIAALTDIQVAQRQQAAVLASLTESSAIQQSDLKRISRQVTLLTVQVDSLRGTMSPLTTSSIPTPSSTPTSNARVRMVRTSRKTAPATPPLPKPVGPVSVGGAPLGPAPATGAGA